MLRRLLTLLALCAGLAAVAEPARASIGMVDSVRLVEQANRLCGVAAQPVGALTTHTLDREPEKPKFCPRPGIVIVVPTVMLQVDRAHE